MNFSTPAGSLPSWSISSITFCTAATFPPPRPWSTALFTLSIVRPAYSNRAAPRPSVPVGTLTPWMPSHFTPASLRVSPIVERNIVTALARPLVRLLRKPNGSLRT